MEGEIIKALKVIMNNKMGLEIVTQTKGAMKKIALCLASNTIDRKIREMVLDLLTVCCMEAFVPGGHEYVYFHLFIIIVLCILSFSSIW